MNCDARLAENLRGVLVFDLDDTLYPEADYVKSGFEAVGRWLEDSQDVRGFAALAWALHCEGLRGKVFDLALERLGLAQDEVLIRSMIDVYRAHAPTIALATETSGLLRTLAARARLCLISDGPLQSQMAKVKALGLCDYFDHIRCTDEWGREFWKPHPRAFREVAALFPMSGPWRYTYIGDNPAKDFVAPRAMGWRSLRLRREGGLHERAEPADADNCAEAEISTLAELPAVLSGWGLV